MHLRSFCLAAKMGWLSVVVPPGVLGAEPASRALSVEAAGSDGTLARYFRNEARVLQDRAQARLNVSSAEEAQVRREELRRELLDMLGLWPMPQRTELKATRTGVVERDDFAVEKIHFQSMPGLYVTGNLYRPRQVAGKLPAVLYVCGHARVATNGVSCGNKTAYQHHGIWLARHGYIALLIDTLQLGEIEGVHHGTHRLGQWWWNSRGYSPAGLEAWNGVRALDYLESRSDVDASRLGMTGRSGGGSYTWTTAAIDERVRAAAPVAGITDLRNQVVDGVVEGHCDCMFFVNTHRWDFVLNAALVAPRALLVVNTDTDPIFPLDGVHRLFADVRPWFSMWNARDRLGLAIGPGGHEDTQDLQVPVFRWFDRHLAERTGLIRDAAEKLIPPSELRVFQDVPVDERNTRAQEWFGPAEGSRAPRTEDPEKWAQVLRERAFAGWPQASMEGEVRARRMRTETRGVWRGEEWAWESQPEVPLRLLRFERLSGAAEATSVRMRVLGDDVPPDWELRHLDNWLDRDGVTAREVIFLETRGVGAGQWAGDAARRIQIRRRFMLAGQTVDGMRVWDIVRALAWVRSSGIEGAPVELLGDGTMGVNALAAAMFGPPVAAVSLSRRPASWRDGPDYLNVAQVLDWPTLVEWVARRGTRVTER